VVTCDRATVVAQPDATANVAAIEKTVVDAIARAEPSVVAISRSTPQQTPLVVQGLGDAFGEFRQNPTPDAAAAVVAAGVFIHPSGLVLTQYLAARADDRHTVTTIDGQTYAASIRAADPRSGLAILAIDRATGSIQQKGGARNAAPGSFPAIRFGSADELRKGQFVIAIGNPFAVESDGQPTASWGIVTNLARKAPPETNLNDASGPYNDFRTTIHHLGTLIQTDAKLGWSAGGGALVNMRGELVGLTTTAATIAGHEQPAGYAIPISTAMRRIIDTLKQGREVEYGMLGIGFGQPPLAPAGARNSQLTVAQVYAGGPAARAGLRSGDVITRIGEKPVTDVDAVQLAVSILPPATDIAVAYERDGRSATANVTLAKLAVVRKSIATVRPPAWLGIRIDYATALDATQLAEAISSNAYDPEGCVLVVEVEPQSEAWQAGVRPGMFISHVGGTRVATPENFRAATKNVGEKFDIKLTQPIVQASDGLPN